MFSYSSSFFGILGSRFPLNSLGALESLPSRKSPRGFLSLSPPLKSPPSLRGLNSPSLRGLDSPSLRGLKSPSRRGLNSPSRRGLNSFLSLNLGACSPSESFLSSSSPSWLLNSLYFPSKISYLRNSHSNGPLYKGTFWLAFKPIWSKHSSR